MVWRAPAASMREASVATMYDDMTRDELVAECQRWKEQAARNGQTAMRYQTALRLARKFGMASTAFEGGVSVMLADWFDSHRGDGIPWPTSPVVQKWLSSEGFSEVADGRIGMRATMTLAMPPVTN